MPNSRPHPPFDFINFLFEIVVYRRFTQYGTKIMKPLVPAALFLVPTMALVIGTSFAAPSTGTLGVVFPFGTSQRSAFEIVMATGGAIVTTTRLDNVLVVASEDESFQARVRAAGALFFFNAAGLCGDQELSQS